MNTVSLKPHKYRGPFRRIAQRRFFAALPTVWLRVLTIHFATTSVLIAANWPAWRGPHGTGVCDEKNLPLRWSTNENVRWRVSLPERGNATPIVWGNRVFVTQAIEKESRRTLLCFDRANGALLWQQGPTYPEKEMTHDTNPQCASSPVTDGERVVAWFGSAGLYAYDFTGKELWRRDLGRQAHIWGTGSSPAIYGDLCFLNFGPGERTFLIAVNKKTGQTVWQVDEPGGDSGEKKPGQDKPLWIGSWSTPVLIQAGGREELVLTWPKRVVSFNPKTGKELWTCAGINPLVYTSPLYEANKEIIVAMGGFGGMALAVKAGGSGDVTATHRLWQHPKTKQRIGSGVIHDGHIYILNDPGVAECWELESGKLIWEERLTGAGKDNTSWSSMVLSDGKLYVVNHSGDTFVLKASPKFELLATNSLYEHTNASVAVSNGEIFLRTYQHLWCIR
jgi:outer membrane protein assembly factor BamB